MTTALDMSSLFYISNENAIMQLAANKTGIERKSLLSVLFDAQ